MKICLAFLLVILLLKNEMSIQKDVCIFPEEIYYMAIFDDHVCEKSFCRGKLNYKCGPSHCATNKRTCFNFFKKTYLDKTISIKRFKKSRCRDFIKET